MTENESSIRQDKVRKALTFLLPFVYVAVLSGSVTGEVFWADDPGELAFVRNAASVWSLCGYDVFQLFRPVKNFIWLGFSFLEPFGLEWCHAVSVVFGVLSIFPVLALCRRVFGSEWKALAAVAVWILSPTLVSSVAWLSCLNIQVMVAFVSLAIVFHDKAWDGGSVRIPSVLVSGLFLFLALVSYECAIAAVPIVLLFDVLLRHGRLRFRKAWMVHAFYWFVAATYLVLRWSVGAKEKMAGRWVVGERWQLIVSSPYFTLQHFASWFWPFGRFTVTGSYQWGDVSPAVLVGCAALCFAVLAFVLFSWRKRPVLCFCILFAVFGFAPVSNCLGFGNGPYGDYYLSLASVGLAAGCVEAAWQLWCVRGVFRIPAVAGVIALVAIRVAFVPEAARWAGLWAHAADAFEESTRNYPRFVSDKIGVLRHLLDDERYEEALKLGRQIEDAVGPDSPNMEAVYLVRAQYACLVDRDPETAFSMIERYRSVAQTELAPLLFHYYRGRIYESLVLDENLAEAEYRRCLVGELTAQLIPCADRLALLLAKRGELDEALTLWEKARMLSPNNPLVLWNLSKLYRRIGRTDEADVLLNKVETLTGQSLRDVQ